MKTGVLSLSDSYISALYFASLHTPLLQGTKLACGEGGCGACAVQVTSYDPATGTLALGFAPAIFERVQVGSVPDSYGDAFADSTQTSSINSCLCPVGTLDGVAITTAEGLGNSRTGFSSVQGMFCSRASWTRSLHSELVTLSVDLQSHTSDCLTICREVCHPSCLPVWLLHPWVCGGLSRYIGKMQRDWRKANTGEDDAGAGRQSM